MKWRGASICVPGCTTICTSVTLARCSGILLICRMRGCGNDGMRDNSSVSLCDRSIQGPLAPEIFGAGRSSQPFQPGILVVSDSHMSAPHYLFRFTVNRAGFVAANDDPGPFLDHLDQGGVVVVAAALRHGVEPELDDVRTHPH